MLRKESFTLCKAKLDIWMCRNGDQYRYAAVYVNDLAFAVKESQIFFDILKTATIPRSKKLDH